MSQQLFVKETPWKQYSLEKMIIAPLIINFRFVFKMYLLAKIDPGFLGPQCGGVPHCFRIRGR